MKCSFCGFEFNEDEAQLACNKCALIVRCELIKCPNCNFKLAPPEPQWMKRLRQRRKKKNDPDR